MTTTVTQGNGDTSEVIVVRGLQPGKAAIESKVSASGRELVPARTAAELDSALTIGRARLEQLETELAGISARLVKARATSPAAEREIRDRRSELWSRVRAYREHIGLLEIEARDLQRSDASTMARAGRG